MRRLIFTTCVLFVVSCAGNQKPLQVATVTHDTLALAQDIEARLCWGVSDAYHAPTGPAAMHCTEPAAGTIGLTDARHKLINSKLRDAWLLYRSLVAATAAGTQADYTTFNGLLTDVLAVITSLQQTDLVVQLQQAVTQAKK